MKTEAPLPVTIVNHLAIDIRATADALWADILETFVETAGWQAEGYAIVPLDDPAAILGGYHMQRTGEDGAVDERRVFITECDHDARRLSLFVDFLSVADGLHVHATYHAHAAPDGSRYTIDCHSRLGIERPADGSREKVAAVVDAFRTGSDTYLTGYLGRVKARLEGGAGEVA